MILQRNLLKTLVVSLFISITFTQCTDSIGTQFSDLDNLPSNIFTDLVKSDIAPFNKLTKESIIHFNDKLVFSEEGEIIGGDHTKVELELTPDEFNSFFYQLYNKNVVFLEIDEMPEIEPNDLEARDCIIWVVAGLTPFGPTCSPGMGYCSFCIPDYRNVK